ncbi:aspartate dehydrogenase [Nitratireductor aquimarinus]|uniref:aspartate dehydrogenase n=1 Tax=Nitratireductor TaxID=245876 RepID=UPI0019D3BE11|nr:aspartate dehydrogenase [Nitratireductor aquimarinus]MBN7776247.1 aspartate dehydrogenase [Nitratireductor pacificus]MBN7779114.1 aspartate dehydrogenase [Nitratireductor pacificus]MBN7787921.1 aspartate dehydrogenase [Nitratireductor aquimarinus]MBY6097968.1 aspartate dehydrogenase [Nitratireductor aquimarinus]MCA1259844.1 aspartate dehydrogenase [Nitratireductor aquimarinus]
MTQSAPISVTIAGLGAIGFAVARAIDEGRVPGARLAAVSASDLEGAKARLSGFRTPPAILPLDEAVLQGDIVVECLPPALFREVAEPVLKAGRTVLAVSVGALLANDDLPQIAAQNGGTLLLPSGAVGALDAVRAACQGDVRDVLLTTEKPVSGFQQSDYLTGKGIQLSEIAERTCLFEGSAREGIAHFPKNVNVVAALALAGIGADRTRLSLWADPALSSNCHSVRVESAAAEVSFRISNLPDPANPRTSALTAHSVVAALCNHVSAMRFV